MTAEAVNNVQGIHCRSLFEGKFETKLIPSSAWLCCFFKINYITKLKKTNRGSKISRRASSRASNSRSVNPIRCYVFLGCHSLLILPVHPELDTDTVCRANLQYQDAPKNVTRITGTDCVPQHAYYHIIIKVYQLFLYEPTSKDIFTSLHRDVTAFITEQLNIGIQEGREFFENKIKVFLSKHPDFLKVTDEKELQDRINFLWDLLRTDIFKNVKNTCQLGVVSTISSDDVKEDLLKGQGTVSPEAKTAFNETVYGFHVSLCIGDYIVSMSLDREQLFRAQTQLSFSFFNSEILLYMSSPDFMIQVNSIITDYYFAKQLGPVPMGIKMANNPATEFTFFECGCKTIALHWYNTSTRSFELTTNIKLPGRAEHIVSTNQQGQYYMFVNNFPSMGIMRTMVITGGILPTYDEQRVNHVLDIQFGDTSNDSMKTSLRDSQPSSLTDDDQEQNDTPVAVEAGAAAAAAGEVNMVGTVDSVEAVEVGRKRSAVEESNPNPSRIKRIKTGIQTACSWLKEIFNLRTPTCSVDIKYRNDRVVFCMPTHREHNRIQDKILKRYRESKTSKHAGCRPVSRKYVSKNISHKKGRRMFVTHRRSLRLEKLK